MNQSERTSAAAIALSVIRNITYLDDQDLPRPVLVRLAWFSLGAVLMLASVRTKPTGRQEEPGFDSPDHGAQAQVAHDA